MKRKLRLFFVGIIFINLYNSLFGLTPLPQNSYLQYKDNLKEVKILQEILNSDPDTLVTDSGAGSPGRENWFFGRLTEDAVKRYQIKNDLTPSGKVDFKTLRKLNAFVNGSLISTNTNSNQTAIKKDLININEDKRNEIKKDLEENIYLNNTNSNPYTDEPTNANLSTINTPPTSTKTLLQQLLDKYTNYFNPNSTTNLNTNNTPTQDIYSNSYSSKTPYYNPQSGNYSSNPSSSAGQSQSSQSANPYLGNAVSPYGQTPFSDAFNNGLPAGPKGPGIESSAGKISRDRGDIGQCRATSFAHATLAEGCVADRSDQQNNQKAASGQILSRTGVPAIPAVALPKSGSMGDAVEVKDLSTGKCKAFPLLDRGPGAGPLSKGVCIDLTGSAVDILKGRQPCKTVGNLGEGREGISMVQYAIIPGEKIAPGQTKECTHLGK